MRIRIQWLIGVLFLYFCHVGLAYTGSSGAILTAVGQADWTVAGEQQGVRLGARVSAAGDVNGDGYGDIMVSVLPDFTAFDTFNKVYVFHGSATGPGKEPDWSLVGSTALSGLGKTVLTIGDVNNDGFGDVAVNGGIYYKPDFSQELRVLIYYGAAGGLGTTANVTLYCDRTDSFGDSMTAGDLNGDGYDDLVVAEPSYQNYSGRISVHYGSGIGLATTATMSITGAQSSEFLGNQLACADVNGDGYDDVIAGFSGYKHTFIAEGIVRIYYGSAAGLSTTAGWSLYGTQEYAALGASLASAGDINSDGFDDLIISRQNSSGGGMYEWQFGVYFGTSAGPNFLPDWAFTGDISSLTLAPAMGVGDVNNDGYGDILLGATGQQRSGKQEVLLYCGSAAGLPQEPNRRFECEQDSASFGSTVAPAGDVNNDGYDDILIGASQYNISLVNQGQAFCYYGSHIISGVGETDAYSLSCRITRSILAPGETLDCELEMFVDGTTQVQLMDMYGRIFLHQTFSVHGGYQTLSIALPEFLASGRYFVQLITDRTWKTLPFTILR